MLSPETLEARGSYVAIDQTCPRRFVRFIFVRAEMAAVNALVARLTIQMSETGAHTVVTIRRQANSAQSQINLSVFLTILWRVSAGTSRSLLSHGIENAFLKFSRRLHERICNTILTKRYILNISTYLQVTCLAIVQIAEFNRIIRLYLC